MSNSSEALMKALPSFTLALHVGANGTRTIKAFQGPSRPEVGDVDIEYDV